MAIDRAAGANYLLTAADAWHVRDRAFTVMWWVRLDTRPGSGTWWSLAAGYEGNSANWVAAFVGQTASNTRFSFGWQTGPSTFSNFPETSGVIVPTGEWMHVALVYYSGSSLAWDSVINGLVNYSVTTETLAWPTSTAASLYLGYDPGNASGPDGQLAYYRMFEGALTLGEIRNEMHSAVPVNRRFPCSVDISLDPIGGGSQVIGVDRSFRRVHPSTVTGTVNWTADAPPVRPVVAHVLLRRPWLWGAGAGGTTYTQDLAGGITPAGALTRQAGKALSGSTTPAGTLARMTSKPLAGALTPAGTLIRAPGKQLAGALTPSAGLIRQAGKALGGSTAPAGNLTRQTGKTLAGAITPTGVVATIRTLLLSLAGAITPAGTLSRQTGKALSGSATPTGAVTKLVAKAFGGGITPAGALLKLVGKLLGGSATPVGAVTNVASQPSAGAGTMRHATRAAATSGYATRTAGSAGHAHRDGPTMTGR